MTPVCANPSLRRTRASTRLAAIFLGVGLSCATVAQDTNPVPCSANEKNDAEHCNLSEKKAEQAVASELDWVPLKDVPESLRDRQCINCDGRYIDPLAGKKTDIQPKEENIHANADRTRMDGDKVYLIGNAIAVQGNRTMRSDDVTIDREDESAFLSGNIMLREPNILVLGDAAEVYSKTDEAVVHNGNFVFHEEHMRGTADMLERDSEGLIHIHNGSFTYCAPGDNDWMIKADNLEIDLDEGLATARDATLELKGTPVFYSPWLRFPLDDRRRTGLLWPDFGNDSGGGLDISAPVYLNLAPNYDALYAPRFIEERGLNHGLTMRYLNPLFGEWLVGGAFMPDDKRYKDETLDGQSTDRWLSIIQQNGLFNQRWRSQIDYSKASDVDYLKDLETSNINAQRDTSLLQLAKVDYLGDNWLFGLRTQQFQSLANDIREDYEEKPQFNATYRSKNTPFELEPIMLAQYTNFEDDRDIVTGQRVYGEAGLRYPMLWPFGYIKPTVKWRQVNYELSDSDVFSDNSPSTGTPLANLDGGLVFERQTSFGDRGVLQTLEPRIYYLYSEYEDQRDQPAFDAAELTFTYYQLFRETRFSGHDRLDDANQISLGLTSRLIDDQTGRSMLNASLGQIYYFKDRKVRLGPLAPAQDQPSSEIAGNLDFKPTQKLGLRTSLVWDPHESRMNSSFFEAGYKADNGSLFNVGYSYRRRLDGVFVQPTNAARASTYLPLNDKWSIFGAINYSVEDNVTVDDMLGVEYDTCCWTVRLLQLQYYNNVSGVIPDFNNPDLERERTVQFQFLLKGMGGFGNRITNIMQSMIRGYDEREY